MKSSIVLLISCGRRKSEVSCPASEMYNSERFTLSKQIANQLGYDWYIISAKYGLLSPNTIIEPYDVCLSSFSDEAKRLWARNVSDGLKGYSRGTTIVVFANGEYSDALSSALKCHGFSVVSPFSKMREDEMVTYLRNVSFSRVQQIRTLYSTLNDLGFETGGIRRFKDCDGKMYWPRMGVYFILDFNERSLLSGGAPRIVRVGTHAVSRGAKSTLWGRLKTHKGTNSGSGSHRSSVFRLHVGNAIINRDGLLSDTWGTGQNANKVVREREVFIEEKVSEYIGNLGIVFLAVEDEPSPQSDRSKIEKSAISLLSSINFSFEFGGQDWLGNYSPRKPIQLSSLWNIDYVNETFSLDLFSMLDQYTEFTLNQYRQRKA